jgi:hypothetical protein
VLSARLQEKINHGEMLIFLLSLAVAVVVLLRLLEPMVVQAEERVEFVHLYLQLVVEEVLKHL